MVVKNQEIWTFKVNSLCQKTSECFYFFSLENINLCHLFCNKPILLTSIFKLKWLQIFGDTVSALQGQRMLYRQSQFCSALRLVLFNWHYIEMDMSKKNKECYNVRQIVHTLHCTAVIHFCCYLVPKWPYWGQPLRMRPEPLAWINFCYFDQKPEWTQHIPKMTVLELKTKGRSKK